jgi:Ca2+-binding EF-hand superfamily protein
MEFWNRLDTFIVVTSWIDFILKRVSNEDEGLNALAALRLARMERLLKVLRLLRLVRLLKFLKELLFLVRGLIASVYILTWFMLIIFIVCWATATLLTTFVGQNNVYYNSAYRDIEFAHEKYFGTQFFSMLTLFQVLTSDRGWFDDVMRSLSKYQPSMAFILALFSSFATFGLTNLMVGMVVDAILENSKKHAEIARRCEAQLERAIFTQLYDFFRIADTNHSGTVTLEEVTAALNEPEIYNKMQMIGFSVEWAPDVFAAVDFEDEGEVTILEFIKGCLRIRGVAKSKDLVVAQLAVLKFSEHVAEFEEQVDLYTEKVQKMYGISQGIINQGEMVFLNAQEFRQRHKSYVKGGKPSINVDALDKADKIFKVEDVEDEDTWSSPFMQLLQEREGDLRDCDAVTDNSVRFMEVLNVQDV